ncbi:MAG: 2OG-Fe(II) oxygenase [Agarilytica sp.]
MSSFDSQLFSGIAEKVYSQGYCVIENALPNELAISLLERVKNLEPNSFKDAGVGRKNEYAKHEDIRQDQIFWIDGICETEKSWLEWTSLLQQAINQQLFLGLFSYESHFAHYKKGEFYKKHVDAFRGQSNRKLSTVTYLNPEWDSGDGGELLIYSEQGDQVIEKVMPHLGTLVVFLSEVFPHEVLPATQDRFSIAGWFRVNEGL